MTLEIPNRQRLALDRINCRAADHGIAVSRLKWDRTVDKNLLFTSPTLAPLSHTAVFTELNSFQQRRYNQLVGMMQNELICFFEQEIGTRVIPALLETKNIAEELVISLKRFLAEGEGTHKDVPSAE